MKIFITILSTLSTLFALNPQEIADNVKKSSDGFGYSRSVMEMVLIDASKNKSVREIISYAKERKMGIIL